MMHGPINIRCTNVCLFLRSAVRTFVCSQTVSWTCNNLTRGLSIHRDLTNCFGRCRTSTPLRCSSEFYTGAGGGGDSMHLVTNSLCLLFKDARYNFPAVYSYHEPDKATPHTHALFLSSSVLACVSSFHTFLQQCCSISHP